MLIFDPYFARIDGYLADRRGAGRRVAELADPASTADSLCSSLKVGPGAGCGLVMKSDTFRELGSPALGSSAFVLATERVSQVKDGRIRLIGPELGESTEEALPFGQVVMAAGAKLSDDDYQLLVQSQYTGDRIEGYMVKSIPGRIWGRVSREAAAKGFCLQFLGEALMRLVKAELPAVEAVEVLFVTSGRDDVQRLDAIGAEVAACAKEVRKRVWEKKGIDIAACALGGDCGSCGDKSVCDEVRKIAGARRPAKGEVL